TAVAEPTVLRRPLIIYGTGGPGVAGEGKERQKAEGKRQKAKAAGTRQENCSSALCLVPFSFPKGDLPEGLLRALERADVDRLPENVTLHRLPDGGADLPGVRAGRNVQLGIECIDLERVVMHRARRRRPGAAVSRPAGADLMRPVGEVGALRH